MINAARVVAQEPEHPAPQNSGARSNSWTGLHLSSPPPTVRAPLVGARIRAANRATTHASTVCAQNHAQSSALQLWPIKLGATSLALTLWRSNFGTPTLALQPWRSNFGDPTLALQLWRSDFGAPALALKFGAPTSAIQQWRSNLGIINHRRTELIMNHTT